MGDDLTATTERQTARYEATRRGEFPPPRASQPMPVGGEFKSAVFERMR
jgi:hypothetical protein